MSSVFASAEELAKKPAFQLLEELSRSETVTDMEGKTRPFLNLFDADSGTVLYDLVRSKRPQIILEIGFSHGCSTLFMLQALADNGAGTLITVDPREMTEDGGIGLVNVKRAGLEKYHNFVEGRSEIVLPQLVSQSFRCDFIFDDSNHLFDQTMVEMYFCDKLLVAGGTIVFDDYSLLSIKAACNFFETNLNYRLDASHTPRLRVLSKTGDDAREWYYFVPFDVPVGNQGIGFEREKAEKKNP